ncbi:MAG: SGNH/GDSL hydrolase family protein, partial [Imperialibacter sp.]
MKKHINYWALILFLLPCSVLAQKGLDAAAIKASANYGKSVAVFGGSVSVIPDSDSAKVQWERQLGMKITNYGVSGAGFSSLQGKSLQQQVDEAGVFDIYILWASTNDYTNKRAVG